MKTIYFKKLEAIEKLFIKAGAPGTGAQHGISTSSDGCGVINVGATDTTKCVLVLASGFTIKDGDLIVD
ncbi:MAG: hypothetical protein GY765_14015 [bacterium]|nr:hypothetical protein [bacterium]